MNRCIASKYYAQVQNQQSPYSKNEIGKVQATYPECSGIQYRVNLFLSQSFTEVSMSLLGLSMSSGAWLYVTVLIRSFHGGAKLMFLLHFIHFHVEKDCVLNEQVGILKIFTQAQFIAAPVCYVRFLTHPCTRYFGWASSRISFIENYRGNKEKPTMDHRNRLHDCKSNGTGYLNLKR